MKILYFLHKKHTGCSPILGFNGYTFRGCNSAILVFFLYFHFTSLLSVDPFIVDFCCHEKQVASHDSCLPLKFEKKNGSKKAVPIHTP